MTTTTIETKYLVMMGANERGPYTAAQIGDLLRQGLVGTTTLVKKVDGGEAKELAQVADLAAHLPVRSTAPHPAVASAAPGVVAPGSRIPPNPDFVVVKGERENSEGLFGLLSKKHLVWIALAVVILTFMTIVMNKAWESNEQRLKALDAQRDWQQSMERLDDMTRPSPVQPVR